MDSYIVPSTNTPNLRDLNDRAIEKLYTLIGSIDAKSEPDLIRACVESVAKLNTSIKNSDIIAPPETAEERQQREQASVLEAEIRG